MLRRFHIANSRGFDGFEPKHDRAAARVRPASRDDTGANGVSSARIGRERAEDVGVRLQDRRRHVSQRTRRSLVAGGELLQIKFNRRFKPVQSQVCPRFPAEAGRGQTQPVSKALFDQLPGLTEMLNRLLRFSIAAQSSEHVGRPGRAEMALLLGPVKQCLPRPTGFQVVTAMISDEAAKVVGKFSRQTFRYQYIAQNGTTVFHFVCIRRPLLAAAPVIQRFLILPKFFPFGTVLLQNPFALLRRGVGFPQSDIQIGQVSFDALNAGTVCRGQSLKRGQRQFHSLQLAIEVGYRRREHRAVAAIKQRVGKVRAAGEQRRRAEPTCQCERPDSI